MAAGRYPFVKVSTLAFIAAVIFFGILIPAPRNTNGGTVKMILIIFLGVCVRAIVMHYEIRSRKTAASSKASTQLKRIATGFPLLNPKLTEFPSGAVTLDLTIGNLRYCTEYFPSSDTFGLSKVEGAAPFSERREESFDTGEQLEARILELMKLKVGSGV